MKALILLAAALNVVTVQAPAKGVRFSKNVVVLYDVSGSMKPVAETAVKAMRQVAGQPTDDMRLKVISFGSAVHSWKKDWTLLPSQTALKELVAWIGRNPNAQSTYAVPAIQAALKIEPAKPLTVVLITDGQFFDAEKAVQLEIARLQAKRKVAASICVIEVRSYAKWSSPRLASLSAYCTAGHYYVAHSHFAYPIFDGTQLHVK